LKNFKYKNYKREITHILIETKEELESFREYELNFQIKVF